MNQKSFRFRPTVQQLEDRTVPAGNVTAAVIGGVLVVNADSGGDLFSVVGGPGNTAAIRSLDGITTINGQIGPVPFQGISQGLRIAGGTGNDVIGVEGFHTKETVLISGGGGNDIIHLNGVIAGKGGIVATSDGDDQLYVSTSDFGSLFSTSMFGGNDFVSVLGSHFKSAALLNGGTGSNTISATANAAEHGLGNAGFVPGSAPANPTAPSNPTDPNNPSNPSNPTPSAAPTLTLSTSTAASTNATSIPVTAVFSSAVSGFTAAKLSVGNATVTNFTQVSATNYTFNLIPAAQGAVTVSAAAGAGTTSDGVASVASNSLSVTFDNVSPSTTVTVAASTAASPIAFTVRFSEGVTGFTQSDVSVSNGTVASVTPVSATTYTVNVTPAGDGPVNVTILPNSAFDAAGNGNTVGSAATNSIRTSVGLSTTIPDSTDPSFVAVGAQGLKIKDIQVGTGTATVASNSQIQVFYKGYLVNGGTVFDQSVTTGAPANFTLSQLIAGFQQGTIGMKAGGIRQIFIPSALGYGSGGNPPNIPGNADLVFDVKIVSIT